MFIYHLKITINILIIIKLFKYCLSFILKLGFEYFKFQIYLEFDFRFNLGVHKNNIIPWKEEESFVLIFYTY